MSGPHELARAIALLAKVRHDLHRDARGPESEEAARHIRAALRDLRKARLALASLDSMLQGHQIADDVTAEPDRRIVLDDTIDQPHHPAKARRHARRLTRLTATPDPRQPRPGDDSPDTGFTHAIGFAGMGVAHNRLLRQLAICKRTPGSLHVPASVAERVRARRALRDHPGARRRRLPESWQAAGLSQTDARLIRGRAALLRTLESIRAGGRLPSRSPR